MTFKKFLAALIVCVACASAAHADDKQAASQFANDLGHKALSIITGGESKDAKQQKLEELFAQNVDIDWIGTFVLGRYWKTATDDQEESLPGKLPCFHDRALHRQHL